VKKSIRSVAFPGDKATTRLRSAIRNFVALSCVAEWAIFQRLTHILGAPGLDNVSSTQWIHIVEWIAPFAKGSPTGECKKQELKQSDFGDKSSLNIPAKMKERA